MVQITAMDESISPGSTRGCTHGIGLVRNPTGQLVQQTRANTNYDSISSDIPLQTPPVSVAQQLRDAILRLEKHITAEGSTAPESPSSVMEARQHAQQTFDRQRQQQHASTDSRGEAPTTPQPHTHIHQATSAHSAASQPSESATRETRPPADEATTTGSTANHRHRQPTEPQLECGLLAHIHVYGMWHFESEASACMAAQAITAQPPLKRSLLPRPRPHPTPAIHRHPPPSEEALDTQRLHRALGPDGS